MVDIVEVEVGASTVVVGDERQWIVGVIADWVVVAFEAVVVVEAAYEVQGEDN